MTGMKQLMTFLMMNAMADPLSELHNMPRAAKPAPDEEAAERCRRDRAARKLASWNKRNGL